MANIKELIQSIESGDSSFDEKLAAINQMEETLVAMREQEQEAVNDNVELIIEALRTIEAKVEAKLRIIPEKGEQGIQGQKGEQGDRGLDGAQGKDGKSGIDGKDGLDGKDGVSVQDAKIDFDGSLVITLSDGREINVGEVVPVDVAQTIHKIQSGSGGDSQTTLNAIAALQATIATYGTMATQNANNVAITGGTINNTTVGATTPAAGVFTTLTATGQTSLGGVAGSEGLRVLTPTLAGNYAQINTNNFGDVIYGNAGSGTNIPNIFLTKGTGVHKFATNNSVSNTQAQVSHTASAVNYVQVTGAATGSPPAISVQGSDTNITAFYQTKGVGVHIFATRGTVQQFRISDTGSAVNYLQAQGSAAGNGLQLSAQGSDTNISAVLQSKGTGAIDLAAGSSGVNISNGGTVTAITRTATGSGTYTSKPTLAISAPTTAGGVQATATIDSMGVLTGTVQSGGTGYTVGDSLSVVGGTGGPQVFTVATVSGGVVTGITNVSFGSYTVTPTNPVSTTGGTGSGCTLNLGYNIGTSFTITNAGSGYVEQPTVTFSGGGGSGAAAYAVVGGYATIKAIGFGSNKVTNQAITFETPNSITSGNPAFIIRDAVSFDSWYQMGPSSTQAFLVAKGNANAIAYLGASGSGSVRLTTNGDSITEQARVAHTASAVNYVQVTGAATGSPPAITVQGSDSNIRMNISSKGTESVDILTNNTGTRAARFAHTASAVNYFQTQGAVTGFGPVLSAQGSDTNIPAVVQPKGTGALQAQQTDSTATGGNARGANAVDWQTVRNAAVQVASGQYSVVSGGAVNRATSSYAVVSGGNNNQSTGFGSVVAGGNSNVCTNSWAFLGAGQQNTVNGYPSAVVTGVSNSAAGYHNFIGAGFTNSGTANAAVTTQSATMNGTTAVTLSGSNASIKVGQWISGTSIADETYVAAISGTSLTLSKVASGSSTSTLSFYTPHGVVVGGGNNTATGSYSFIGGGGDAGTAANRNVASGDWSVVGGGRGNLASGVGSVIVGGGISSISGSVLGNNASGASSFIGSGYGNNAAGGASVIGGGFGNLADASFSTVIGGRYGTTRSITGNFVASPSQDPITSGAGISQTATLVLAKQTTDATATRLTSDASTTGSTVNQVIMPNNAAYFFTGEVVAGVTGGGDTKGWTIEGVIKRGANAASTALVGTPTVTSTYADAGASTWVIAVTADTTNGGLAVTFTGQASTTIRTVAKIATVEMTF